jgi:hypothetical protein
MDFINSFIFSFCSMVRFVKRKDKSSFFSLELPSSLEVVYFRVSLEYTFFFFPSLAMRHLWPTLGKRIYLLMAMLAVSSLEELVELLSESHYLPMLPRHPSCCSTSSSPSFYSLSIVVPVTITCIWKFRNIMTRLTTLVANPLGAGFVLLPLPLLEYLLEALNDKSHLLVVKFGGINWEPFGWRGLLLFFCCLECNGLCLGRGGATLLKLYNTFRLFDHKFKAHKLSNHLLRRCLLIPRILTD